MLKFEHILVVAYIYHMSILYPLSRELGAKHTEKSVIRKALTNACHWIELAKTDNGLSKYEMIDSYETPPSIVIHQKLNLGTSPRAVIGLKIILSKVLIRKKLLSKFSQ